MLDIVEDCTCVPYENLRCCAPKNGISVIQPKCQILPDDRVVNNPAFDPVSGVSYWTYKFLTDCNPETRAISNFVIPICKSINLANVSVYEKIDGCGHFRLVEFELTTYDPNFGTAPSGFQWLKVEVNDRYDKGLCVEYRIQIVGNFPLATEPIEVKAATNILIFDCEGGFLVPECNPEGKLSITKHCEVIIENNLATLSYKLVVSNIGDATLNNVQFLDTIFIPVQLGFSNIIVVPNTLNVDTSIPGRIIISGNLGDINSGGVVNISYSIPITSIETAGKFVISNTAKVFATGTDDTATCFANLEVVRLDTRKCCKITNFNQAEFVVTILSQEQSPTTTVNMIDYLFIPSGVTLQFNSFDECVATYANTGELVPLNKDITGPQEIKIICNGITVSSGGIVQRIVKMTFISSSAFNGTIIRNEVESVSPTLPNRQIFLGTGVFPVGAGINVRVNINCENPCINL